MDRKLPGNPSKAALKRRRYTKEFRLEAVQMLLVGHSAASISERYGLSGPRILYRWKAEQLNYSGPIATSLADRNRHLETELLRVTRERDILTKALAIFGRNG